MAELITKQLQALQFNSEVATAADVSSFVNASTTELSSSLIARIQALEGFSTFIGVKDALPESAENGQIVIVGEKEYIWGPKADGVAGWTELGDTTAEAASITELSSAVADLATTKADVSAVNASVEALTKAIGDVEASLSGYDTVGSADAALTSAKAYTDEKTTGMATESYVDDQIAVVEADISSLTDTVETKADKTEVKTISDTLATFGDIVTHNASEFDLSGSADAAQEAAISAAKAYTDEQIALVEGEISSLADIVETKADQTAVDAAISAINENISTLSAKAEEDPVFTAWKDGESIALGSGAIAAGATTTAIGAFVVADGANTTAIGGSARASGDYATAIGNSTLASKDYAIAIGNGAEATESCAAVFGASARATGDSATAIGASARAEGYNASAFGTSTTATGANATAIGTSTTADGVNTTAIGVFANAHAKNAVQIGEGENNTEGSLQFRSTQIVNGDGKITTTNLAGMDTLKTAVSAIEEVTAEDNVQVLREAVNTLVAAIKTFVGL